MNNKQQEEKYAYVISRFQEDPAFLIEMFWGLTPQPIKPQYLELVINLTNTRWEEWEESKKLIRPEYFEPFVKHKHITWQQWLILLSVRKAMMGHASKRISIASGHGIGKSAVISWIMLWYLFCFKDAQVPCTAPTADQLYDVLWKELNLWITRIQDEGVKSMYIWESNHIRMASAPGVWFARAKTSSKNNTEALAGVHADHVLLVADEASGVEEQIFEVAESALTNENVLILYISNPTRDSGYFYDTHHKYAKKWQNLQFDSEESPIVDIGFVKDKEEKHGRDGVEFKIRVKGQFPDSGIMDETGYTRLLQDSDIRTIPVDLNIQFIGEPVLAVDPSGEGDDETAYYIRDMFKAYLVAKDKNSTSLDIAAKLLTLKEKYDIQWSNIVVENFGVGADVSKHISLLTKGKANITTISTGELCELDSDREKYINVRTELYWKMREWFITGGLLVEDKVTKGQLTNIRFKRNIRGKFQIIPKLELRKRYGQDSPDRADALMLTFARSVSSTKLTQSEKEALINSDKFDEYSNY